MTTVVSGRFKARPKEVKAAAESPRPWRRRRMFGLGVEVEGGIIVTVRISGKSDAAGTLDGIVEAPTSSVFSEAIQDRGCAKCGGE